MFRHCFVTLETQNLRRGYGVSLSLLPFWKAKRWHQENKHWLWDHFFWALFPSQFLRSLLWLRFLWQPFRWRFHHCYGTRWWLLVWSVVWWWVIQQLLADLLKHELIFVVFLFGRKSESKIPFLVVFVSTPHLVNWNKSCFAVFFHSKMARLATDSDGFVATSENWTLWRSNCGYFLRCDQKCMLWSESCRPNGCSVAVWPSGGERMCENLVWESRSVWRCSTLRSLGHADGCFWATKSLQIPGFSVWQRPSVWTFLDLSASFVPIPHPFWEHTSVALLTEGLVLWLLAFPSVKDLLIMFCTLTRAKGGRHVLKSSRTWWWFWHVAFFWASSWRFML